MRTILLTLLVIAFSTSLNAQEAQPIQATTGARVTDLLFDTGNDHYMVGSVIGRIWINGRYTDQYADAYQPVLGKLADDLTFEWMAELEETPWDAKMINNRIYLLFRGEEEASNGEYKTMTVSVYDLDGNWLAVQEIYRCLGSDYDVSLNGRITEHGFLIWTDWAGDDSFLEIDEQEMEKEYYSMVYFRMIGLDGNEKWSYSIQGGEGGFTDLRIQDIETDESGNVYIMSYYSHSADVGIAQFTTEEMYPEESQPLHYQGVFLLQLDADGTPTRAEVFADNEVTVEDMLFDADGNLYVSGYHRGNDTYADKQPDRRPYVGAAIRGEAFEYTDAMSQNAPSDDGFVAKLDTAWNLLWKLNMYGDGYNRASVLVALDNGLGLAGTNTDDIAIGETNYEDHADNKGYSDGFFCQLDADGNVSNVQLFGGDQSNLPDLYINANGEAVVVVGTKTNITINGTDYEGYGYWGGEFLYKIR